MPKKNKVVISGVGLIFPGINTFKDIKSERTPPVSEEPWFDPKKYLGKRGYRYWTDATRTLASAANLSILDANIDLDDYEPSEKSILVGTNLSEVPTRLEIKKIMDDEGIDEVSIMQAPNSSINIPASHVAIKQKIKGPCITFSSFVTSGIDSIAHGLSFIKSNHTSLVLSGTVEDGIPEDTHPATPKKKSVSCLFVLETEEKALKRKSSFYAEIIGCESFFYSPALIKKNKAHFVDYIVNKLTRYVSLIANRNSKKISYFICEEGTQFNHHLDEAIKHAFLTENMMATKVPGIDASAEYFSVSPYLQVCQALSSEKGDVLLITINSIGNIGLLMLNIP